MDLKRRFLYVGDRCVHYLRAGSGPPAVLIHSSPANAWLLLPEIERVSREYTVFAFDTPGFGLSDPLPLDEMIVADLADALAETLASLGMPPCPMFGSHTGAAIALEFGVRHPERITGLVLDGVPAFSSEECEALFGDYFRKLPVSDLGGHFSMVWTRFRDQSVWFPWSQRKVENLNSYDLSLPTSTHLWVSMYFEAADTYTPAYRAASHYGARAIAAAAELTLPTIFTATDTDMLFPHMARLPTLKSNQEIRHIGTSYEAKRELIIEGFQRFGGAVDAPPDHNIIHVHHGIARQFFDGPGGTQVHFRYAGQINRPPLLLIHDAPGSGAALEGIMAVLSETHYVIAPDLPGCGESDPLADGKHDIANYANALLALLNYLNVEQVHVNAIGFGTSVALALAKTSSERLLGLTLEGLLLPKLEMRTDLATRYTPTIDIEADGSHWYRTWLMLRDSQIWWPWYDRRVSALRRVPADFGADHLHTWTLDVMRRRASYGDVIQAALDHDAAAALHGLQIPVTLKTGAATPLSVYDPSMIALVAGISRTNIKVETCEEAAQ